MSAAFPTSPDLMIANAFFAVFVASIVCELVVWPFWPWDWKGKRKALSLKQRDRGWWDE